MHDYHLHTSLCKHAAGPAAAYVEHAIGLGLEAVCFCDHIPLPDGFDSRHRMGMNEMAAYIDTVASLRTTYPEIEILLGVEADYIEGYEPFLEKFLSEYPFDLVMMSVHFIKHWSDGNWVFDFNFPEKPLTRVYHEYFEAVCRGIDTQLFDVVGHLDLIKRPGSPPLASNREDIERVLDAVARTGMSVEINTSGMRKPIGDYYPSLDIVEMMASRDIPVTLGSDAHMPDQVGFIFNRLISELPRERPVQIARYRSRRRHTAPLSKEVGGASNPD